MKNRVMNVMLKVIAHGGLLMAIFGANITCTGGAHQDELPESVKQLRKF